METTFRPQDNHNPHALAIYLRAVLFSRIVRVPGAGMWAITTPDGLVPLHRNRAIAHAKLDTMREVARTVARLACIEVAEGGNAESDVAALPPTSRDKSPDARALTEQSAEGAALVVAAVRESSAGAVEAPRELARVRTRPVGYEWPDLTDAIEAAEAREWRELRDPEDCPRSFVYRDGSRDRCFPRSADGRCVWCERDMKRSA